jgi:hypothetical protein
MQTTPMQEQLRLHILCGDDNHTGSNDSQDFSIGKASSTTVVTVTGAPFTYTGSAQTPATVSVTGAGIKPHRLLIMQTTPMQEQLRLHILCRR